MGKTSERIGKMSKTNKKNEPTSWGLGGAEEMRKQQAEQAKEQAKQI